MASVQLKNLNLSELTLFLGHLRLGEDHLKKQLDNEQYRNLLKLNSINSEQAKRISVNFAEKAGHIALGINTIITSVFGAWMGFSAFLGISLNSYSILSIITLLAFFVCLFVGYFSYKLMGQNAKSAIASQKLDNLQLSILQLIIEKKNEELASNMKFLNHALVYLQKKSLSTLFLFKKSNNPEFFKCKIEDNFSQWIKEISNAVKVKADTIMEKQVYKFYSERLLKILEKLQNIADFYLTTINPAETPSTPPESKCLIQLLSQSRDFYTFVPIHKSWLKQNFLGLAAGCITTLLGCFASMFVFLAGGPNLAKELGLRSIELILRSAPAQLIEFAVASLLTLYYALSFTYNNYKDYIRKYESEETKKQLVVLEKEEIYLKRKNEIIVEIKSQIERIIHIYTAIENIVSYDGQTNLLADNNKNPT